MPLNRYVVRVDPQGQTVTVDVRDTSGVSAAVFESSQFDAPALTLPLVITAPTDFWLRAPGPYDVSCLVGGAEVAAAGAPKRVEVSDVPVLVVPDWERQRTAATTGGSLPVGLGDYAFWSRSSARDATSGSMDFVADFSESFGTAVVTDEDADFVTSYSYPVPKVAVDGVYAVIYRVTASATGSIGAQYEQTPAQDSWNTVTPSTTLCSTGSAYAGIYTAVLALTAGSHIDLSMPATATTSQLRITKVG